MKSFLILFLLFTYSCKQATQQDVNTVKPTTPQINQVTETTQLTISKYTAKFIEEYHTVTNQTIDLSNLSIQVTTSLNGTGNIGDCVGTNVTLQAVFWNSTSTTNSQREQLIFHELKHCALLDPNHDNNTVSSADTNQLVPESIMNSVQISDSLYRRNRTYYLQQLFGNSTLRINTNGSDEFPVSYYQ